MPKEECTGKLGSGWWAQSRNWNKWRRQVGSSNRGVRTGRLLTTRLMKGLTAINFMSHYSRFNILEKKVWLVSCTSHAHPWQERIVAGREEGQLDYQSHKDSHEGSMDDSPEGHLDPAVNKRIREPGHTGTSHPLWAGTEGLQPSHLWWLDCVFPPCGHLRSSTRKSALEWPNMAAQERAVGNKHISEKVRSRKHWDLGLLWGRDPESTMEMCGRKGGPESWVNS